jgi:hypothetical protein
MKHSLFKSWCIAQGISSPLTLQGTDSRYRFMSSVENDVSGNLLNVPLDACITADTTEALAERLIFEKSLGSDSKFAPFIDMFPSLQDLKDMPRFWDLSRLEKVMDGGQLKQRIKYSESKDADPWALAICNSRANYLDDFSYSLTPVLDMINHDASVPTRATVIDGAFVLSVDKTFPAGQEAFISYGDLTNLDTLSDYGFISEDNPCNAESLVVKMIRHPSVGVIVDSEGGINIDAIAKLRESVAKMYGQESKGDDLYLQPVSDSNEEEVFSFLASCLQEAVDESQTGAKIAQGDQLVMTYLNERAKTLQKGINVIEEKFPGLEY